MFNVKLWGQLAKEHIKDPTSETLGYLREYLDMEGMKMPKPRYIYDPENIKTWRFLESKFVYNKVTGNYRFQSVLNPKFSFGKVL